MATYFQASVSDQAVEILTIVDDVETARFTLDPMNQVPQFHEAAVEFIRSMPEGYFRDRHQQNLYIIEFQTEPWPES